MTNNIIFHDENIFWEPLYYINTRHCFTKIKFIKRRISKDFSPINWFNHVECGAKTLQSVN